MSASTVNGPKWRNNPFARESRSPSPMPSTSGPRPKSMALLPSPSLSSPTSHCRNQSFSPLSSSTLTLSKTVTRPRANSTKCSNQSNTFAPKFIKTEELQRETERVKGIEGENDFSGKRYVWVRDSEVAFVRGWVMEEIEGDRMLVQCDDGSVGLSQLQSN